MIVNRDPKPTGHDALSPRLKPSSDRVMNQPAKYLTETEVAARLGVSRPTLYRWRRAGIGPAWTRLGPRRLAFDAAALDAWLASQERAPIAAAA